MGKGKGPKKPKVEKYTTNYAHYKLLTLEENQLHNVKNNERLSQIENTSLLFQDYDSKLEAIKEEQDNIDEWNNYLDCDGLPHSHIPCEIREFLHKISVFEDGDFKNSFSWILNIDERSILTQDIDAKNYTRSYLQIHLRKDIGLLYEKFIRELLIVCKNVMKTLETKFRIESPEQYEDIKMLKIDIQEKMKLLYDKLTFRILSNENANMNALTVRTSEFTYKADNFKLDIWTFKNVPITFDMEDMPSVDVLLKTIQIVVTLPFAVLYENLVLRGIYINYDHYSEFSRTSNINDAYVPVEEDFKKKLKSEWKERINIQKDIKDKMKEERQLYEEYLILKELEEKENAKNKEKTAAKANKKKKKAIIEPPVIDNNTFPDVDEDFKAYIQQEQTNLQKQFDPELLELDENEINLREYCPLGGIYELNFVHKTDQVIISNIIMKWFVQPIKLRYINKITEIKEIPEIDPIIERRSRRFTRVGADNVTEKRIVNNFEIIFKIPEYVTKWSDPIPCQFCLGNDLINIQNQLKEKYMNNVVIEINNNISITTPIIINDFNISGYLNNEQIYNIVKYAIPRTISTYQLTDELQEQKKTGGGGLKKYKNLDEDDIDIVNGYDDPNDILSKKDLPERLFPNYPKLQPIVIIEDINKNISEDEKYFHDLINEFQQYQLLKQPYFIVRDLPTKKLKELIALEIKERKRISSKQTLPQHGKLGGGKKGGKNKKGDIIDDNVTNITYLSNDASNEHSETDIPLDTLNNVIKDNEQQSDGISSDGAGGGGAGDDTDNIKHKEDEFVMGSIRENITSITDLEDKTKWSTKHIISSHFNRERSELTVVTDRLGVFGFIFPKFIHFPFQTWSLYPDPENPKENVIFYMESPQIAKFTIKITEKGYLADIRNFGATAKTLQIYFQNEEPLKDLSNLIEEMRIRNLNIFPDADSLTYIKGRLQEKLLPMELHNYNCMAIYSLFFQFAISEWNWISDPRILIFKAGEVKDKDKDLTLIKITPEESSFVEIEELCSADVNNIVLQYTPTWRNIEYNADLLGLITTSYAGAYNNRLKDARLYSYISTLLRAIRPLSSC